MMKRIEGFVPADSIPRYRTSHSQALSKPMEHIIQGFNSVTDAFQHVPKTIYYRGIRLISDKRGVLMIDKWPSGGMELRFRSLRTAKVFAKGWVYDE